MSTKKVISAHSAIKHSLTTPLYLPIKALHSVWVTGVMLSLGGLLFPSQSWAVCTIDNNGLKVTGGSQCNYQSGLPFTTTKTIDGIDYTALILPGPQKAVVYVVDSSILNMNGHSYFELSGGGTRNGVQVITGSVLNVYGNLYTKTYNAENSRALIAQGSSPETASRIHVRGDLFAYRGGSGGSTVVEVEAASHLTVEGDAYIFSDSNPSTHVFRQYGNSYFGKDLTLEATRGAANTSNPQPTLRNRGHLQVENTLRVLTQGGVGIEQIPGGNVFNNEISARNLIIDTAHAPNGVLNKDLSTGNAYEISIGKGTFDKTEINALRDGIVFKGSTGELNFGMGEQVLAPGEGMNAVLAIGSDASIRAEERAIVFEQPTNSYTLIADGAHVVGLQGLYVDGAGNATLELAGNANVTGSISMGDGSDTLILNKNVDLSNVPFMDGGDNLSTADGFADTVIFKDFSSSISGDKLLNWEKVVIDGGSLAFSNNALTTGSDPDQGLFITNGGVQQAGSGFALQGNLHVGNSGTFQTQGNGGGLYQISGDVYHAGVVSLGNTGTGDVFQIAGDYKGQGGTFIVDTVLADDNSASDKIHIQGDSSGTASLKVLNKGGLGAQTVADGIRAVQVDGQSNGTFSLNGDYVHEGRSVVVGGAYAYSLHQGGKTNPSDGHWYLRSELAPEAPPPTKPEEPTPPPAPSYQAGVPIYEVYPQFLLGLTDLPTLQQRVGNRSWSNAGAKQLEQGMSDGTLARPDVLLIDGTGLWGRIEGKHLKFQPRRSTSDADYKYDSVNIQFGYDKLLSQNESYQVVGGVNAHYTNGTADVTSRHGDGKIKTDGYGIGATLTWYGANNVYVDNQARFTWYDSDLSSQTAGNSLIKSNKGHGYAFSTEIGKRYTLDDKWSLTPQAQLKYTNAGFNAFNDAFGANVSRQKALSLQGRLGVSIDYQNSWIGEDGKMRRNTLYGIINYTSDLLQKSQVDVSSVSVSRRNDRHWLGFGVGGSYNWNKDQYSLYGEIDASTGLTNFSKSYGFRGMVGMRVRW